MEDAIRADADVAQFDGKPSTTNGYGYFVVVGIFDQLIGVSAADNRITNVEITSL